MNWKTKGMNRDYSVTAFNPEFAFENRNLRLGTNDNNTLMSWVNERGTLLLPIEQGIWKDGDDPEYATETRLYGIPVGTAVINHKIIVFTHDLENNCDYIYALKYKDSAKTKLVCRMLFGKMAASLGFSLDHPLETLTSYESEAVQKVYWTDGINQPRVINVEGNIRQNDATQFDFVPEMTLNEDVEVEKLLGANGMFAPGVIQYAFTYYRKYGQESNIFYTSPLLYISYKDRGASPEDKVENAFRITVTNPDTKFDYLRIYSIQRTSINATPICKRIQDISLSGLTDSKVSYIDTGTSGDSIDPTELLFKGGESITAETIEQKNNTLFLGNLTIARNLMTGLKDIVKNNVMFSTYDRTTHDSLAIGTRTFTPMQVSYGAYAYYNQLTSIGNEPRHGGMTVPCGGFKTGDWYRCGVQFQYKTGKWSDPIYIKDLQIGSKFEEKTGGVIQVPIIKASLLKAGVLTIKNAGYRKVRPVVVFPEPLDREAICQGVVAPTVFTNRHRNTDKDLYAQSSWFFRPFCTSDDAEGVKTQTLVPKSKEFLRQTNRCVRYKPGEDDGMPKAGDHTPFNPKYIRQVEIQGQFDNEGSNVFQIDRNFRTMHSPDIEFDDKVSLMDFVGVKYRKVGMATFTKTLSDIDIQTESPTVSNLGSGFIHKSFSSDGPSGIVSGLFYEDCIVDENLDKGSGETGGIIAGWPKMKVPAKFIVYPWQGSGSLNNDINRPNNRGTASAVLKKKVISNLRYATSVKDDFLNWTSRSFETDGNPQMFSGEEDHILKFNNNIYKGNIDTMIVPDDTDGVYFAFSSWNNGNLDGGTVADFTSNDWCKTLRNIDTGAGLYKGIWKSNGNNNWSFWNYGDDEIGDEFDDLVIKKLNVRMKYKSSSHIAMGVNSSYLNEGNYQLAIVELYRETDPTTRFGGTSTDALRENTWLPCGEPVSLDNVNDEGNVEFFYDYGDTYYQRYDCLKTYPFTREDPNQIVEIGSFMLETRVNIDGRYDRNRGQMNNLNMSPINFNLMNPVYSQLNNFFSYKIQDDDYYTNNIFPNQLTWSLTKTPGADVDLWANVNLGSILDMDGNKGEITSLQRMNDMLLCFQDSGLAQVLYDENTQISTTAGVPIEIANSGKVQGKRYINDSIGCTNKWSIISGTTGLFFMDSNDRSIYRFNGQLENISVQAGFNTWCKLYFPVSSQKWNPTFPETAEKSAFVSVYDKQNQEILFISSRVCLAFSEKLGGFTSFYDYYNTPFFCNLDDTGIWLRGQQLWKHQAGDYCKFFGVPRPFSTILIGNPEPQLSKIFTNTEFRASVDNDGEEKNGVFTPYLPFDALETWNEYQHGIAFLANQRGHRAMQHHIKDNEASLKRKFRIWRCDIPRDNADNLDTFDETFNETFHMLARLHKHPMDRMNNPWLYLRFRKAADENMQRTEIHDITMTYFV